VRNLARSTFRLALHLGGALAALAGGDLRAQSNVWSLASPDQRCIIAVTLNAVGELSYEVSREGKTVLRKSPFGLRRDESSL